MGNKTYLEVMAINSWNIHFYQHVQHDVYNKNASYVYVLVDVQVQKHFEKMMGM